jgi:hypothetical protein
MAFTPSRRGPRLASAAGKGTSERPVVRTEDPCIRVKNHVTESITLADDAEYDLGGAAAGVYEVRWIEDEREKAQRFRVMPKADIATSAYQRSSTTLTATVAAGATEGLQPGQWIAVQDADAVAAADQYNGVKQVVTTTSTTVTFTVADTGVSTDDGIVTIEVDWCVYPVKAEPVVLWDSIIAADNQDENLGAAQRGIYTVISDGKVEYIASTGAAFSQYAEDITAAGPLAVSHDEVLDATSDTLTALFISSGDVLLRNGADVATKLTVIFEGLEGTGLDQDGSVCLYAKRSAKNVEPTLRLKNRTGASETFAIERVR